MGSTQQFCLKWNNHQSNMLSIFDQLLSSEHFVDVTLACDGLSVRAHKMVLSACSPFFQSLFIQNPCEHPIVILKDIRFVDLKALVQFMYRGEVNVSQDQLPTLLKAAEALKIKGTYNCHSTNAYFSIKKMDYYVFQILDERSIACHARFPLYLRLKLCKLLSVVSSHRSRRGDE